MLLEKHGKSVSLRDVCDMLEGNPMIDDATRAEQVADMIASHLKDAK
jgi:hypothetical protein